MNVYFLRHGRTLWNDQSRYQGRSDVPLSPEGEAELVPAGFVPEAVYVSPLRRTWQTASRLFPGVPQIVIPDFAEMNFGAFEGRTADEMSGDSAYREWVDGGCQDACPPDGPAGNLPSVETRRDFCERVRRAFEDLLSQVTAQDRDGGSLPPLAVVAHGGVLMALMERYALPEQDFFRWLSPKGGGFRLEWDAELWRERRKLRYRETVRYTKC